MMDYWKLLLFLMVLGGVGGVISLRKREYPARGTLFDHQHWSVWVGVLAATLLKLVGIFVLWSPWSFRDRPMIVVFFLFAEILVFTGILLFYRLFMKQPTASLGLSSNQLGFRLIFGLRWIVGFIFVGYGLVYIFLSSQSIEASQDWLARLGREKGMVVALMNFFERVWGKGSLWIPILFMVFFRPFAEEVVFRGFLYGPIRRKTDPVMATLITSFLFMLGAGFYKGHHLASGLLSAYLYERTGSLAPGMLFHGLIHLGNVIYYFDRKSYTLVLVRKTEAGWVAFSLAILFLAVEVVYRLMLRKGYRWKTPLSAS